MAPGVCQPPRKTPVRERFRANILFFEEALAANKEYEEHEEGDVGDVAVAELIAWSHDENF
jgi:hypothetical protein